MPPTRTAFKATAYGASVVALLAVCFWLTSLSFGEFRPSTVAVTYVLWAVSIVAALGTVALGFLLFRHLLKLDLERRQGKPGSRIQTKLVLGVLALGIVPVAIHVFFAITLLNRNFDKWFSQPTVAVLQSAERFMEASSEELLAGLQASAERVAKTSQASGSLRQGEASDELRAAWQETGSPYLALASPQGEILTELVDPQSGPASAIRGAIRELTEAPVSGIADDWLYAAVPITTDSGVPGLLVVGRVLPEPLRVERSYMQDQVSAWSQLEAERPATWRAYVFILALLTLFILFFAVWLALFVAKQITRPIEALVTATGELAGGHLDYRVDTPAADELGSLVASFNRMGQSLETKTGELERSNRELAQANRELDDRRRLIDAILESITPAVISVSEDGEILRFNGAATRLAGAMPVGSLRSVGELVDPVDRGAFEHMFSTARRTGDARRAFEVERSGRSLQLSVTVSSLDSRNGRHGFVVVLEDATDLERAQKSAAWEEVARQVAHEIKNPLTPIALAAGRIDRLLERYATTRTEAEKKDLSSRLAQSTRTIDREVQSLRALVDSFSEVARFPRISPEDTDLNEVVQDAVSVFDGRLEDVVLRFEPAAGGAPAVIDRGPVKRAVVNLIDNAAEVLADSWVKEIVVITRRRPAVGAVELIVADSGPGISPEHKEQLFRPYFSTKMRGSGLGLSIVGSVVHDHRGSIRVEDNQPTGTRFIIELPAAPVTVPALQEAPA